MHAGVPTARVPRANLGRREHLAAGEAIDNRGLPHPRSPEQHDRAAGMDVGVESVEAAALTRADDVNGDVAADRAHLAGRRLGCVRPVRLVQDNNRCHAAVADEREVALQAAQVHRLVEALHDEGRVDVGGQDLFFGLASRDLSRQLVAPGQHHANRPAAASGFGSHADPVPHRRQVTATGRLVLQPSRRLHQPLALLTEDAINVVMLERHATWQQARLRQIGKLRRQMGAPPQFAQLRHKFCKPLAFEIRPIARWPMRYPLLIPA